MAKNMVIKRYTGGLWEEYHPVTSAGNIEGMLTHEQIGSVRADKITSGAGGTYKLPPDTLPALAITNVTPYADFTVFREAYSTSNPQWQSLFQEGDVAVVGGTSLSSGTYMYKLPASPSTPDIDNDFVKLATPYDSKLSEIYTTLTMLDTGLTTLHNNINDVQDNLTSGLAKKQNIITVSSTAPAQRASGDIWFDTSSPSS